MKSEIAKLQSNFEFEMQKVRLALKDADKVKG